MLITNQFKQWWQRLRGQPPVVAAHLALGQRGERLAREYLKRQGYRIVATNLKIRLGRGLSGQPLSGEIDIVAYEGAVLCFVEVKTRTSTDYAPPEAAVNLAKQRQIARTARRYRQLLAVLEEPYRYDVVSVVLAEANRPVLDLHRGYFTDEKLRKRAFAWQHDLSYRR